MIKIKYLLTLLLALNTYSVITHAQENSSISMDANGDNGDNGDDFSINCFENIKALLKNPCFQNICLASSLGVASVSAALLIFVYLYMNSDCLANYDVCIEDELAIFASILDNPDLNHVDTSLYKILYNGLVKIFNGCVCSFEKELELCWNIVLSDYNITSIASFGVRSFASADFCSDAGCSIWKNSAHMLFCNIIDNVTYCGELVGSYNDMINGTTQFIAHNGTELLNSLREYCSPGFHVFNS